MGVSGWVVDPTQANYDAVTKIAGAFAEAFDTAWNDATQLNNLEIAAMTAIVSTEFSQRGPGPLENPVFQTTANWEVPARACIALVLESDAYFAGQGINPGTPGGGGGACVSSGAIITGSFACAENFNNTASGDFSHSEGNNNESVGNSAHTEGGANSASGVNSHAEGTTNIASGDSAHAEGTGVTASGAFSHARGFGTLASGFAASACGFQTEAASDFSVAEGNGSRSRLQGDHAHACGHFGGGATAGANQWRYVQFSGSTPGVAGGESTPLAIGNNTNDLPADGSYYITVKAVASTVNNGAAARQCASYERAFIISTDQAGVTSISSVNSGTDIIVGAAFVGATLIPQASGIDNTWTLTFTLNESVTAATVITAHIEFTELQLN
jgi:hypothetical protein